MEKHRDRRRSSGSVSETSHRCGLSCLGPLTFHCQSVGDKVRLSNNCRLAEKTEDTFKNGLVFSSRPLRLQEKIRVRLEKDSFRWNGALRVGFTNVAPSDRPTPLPVFAIPNLTERPGYWAAPVPESLCQVGSELTFWVSRRGTIHLSSNDTTETLVTGVDLSQPLWAMIDIYGQTSSVFLLGSEKRQMLHTRRSCPASPDVDKQDIDDVSKLGGRRDKFICDLDLEVPAGKGSVADCVVCMEQQATFTLPCGHRCLCSVCVPRVLQQFGSCPLCRHLVRAPSLLTVN